MRGAANERWGVMQTQTTMLVLKILLFPVQYILVGYLIHIGWNMYGIK